MDNTNKNLGEDYKKFIKENKVLNIEELEAKQLSNRSTGHDNKPFAHQEITPEDMMKKESFKSINEFDIEGGDENNSTKEIDLPDAVSEGSEGGSDQKPSLDLKSSAFTPKNRQTASTKSVDEFDIESSDAQSTDKSISKPPKKLTTRSSVFNPNKSKPFVPSSMKQPVQNPSLSQTVNPNSFPYKQEVNAPTSMNPYQPPLTQPTMVPNPVVNAQVMQPGLQQTWQGDYAQQNVGMYNQGVPQNRMQPKKDVKKTNYYLIERLVAIEDLFSFDK